MIEMADLETLIRFSELKIQLKSPIEAKVNGPGDLILTSKYVRFLADRPQPGYSQCGIIPWDEISYINYSRI